MLSATQARKERCARYKTGINRPFQSLKNGAFSEALDFGEIHNS